MSAGSEARRSDRVEILYDRARHLPAASREAFLERLAQDDPDLAGEIASLLTAGEAAGRFFTSLGETLFSGPEGVRDPRDLIPDFDPLYGTRVGPYRVDVVIGRGGMGTVYRAVDAATGEVRALKFLPAYATADEEIRRRFLAEAEATRAVRHPNVGEILDVGEAEGGRLYLVMPLYEGASLKARLLDGPLDGDEMVDWVSQTCAGLTAIHEAGIVHRDLTPGNLFRTTEGTVKLLDFGLAKVADVTLGTGNRPLGTVAYMSPEQLLGERVDARSDLWSLGVMLHEMLTGERPFKGATLSALRDQILDPAPVQSTSLPEAVAPFGSLLDALLARPCDQRPASAAQVGALLDEVAGRPS